MPLPIPTDTENQKDFMMRCIAEDIMVKEYPNIQQRQAVCYTQWRDN